MTEQNRKTTSSKGMTNIANVTPSQEAKDDMQAPQGRDASRASQDTALQHPAHHRRNVNGKRAASKAGQEGSSSVVKRGGMSKPANSKDRKSPRKVYDPDLGRHEIPVVMAPNLMEQIVKDENILQAANKVNSEPHKTAGVDRKTVRQVCTPLLLFPEARDELARKLLKGEYHPGRVRTTYIPKPNGKKRKLGIAIVLDRIVQRMILQAIEANMPANAWSDKSFAYHHGASVADVFAEADKIADEGYQYAVCIDLKGYFDNVPHQRLKAKLYAHVADRRVCKLVWKFVTPVVLDKGQQSINRCGTPQGSVLSPWLASDLNLDELDRELEARNLQFHRYADDTISYCRTKKAAKRVKKRILEFIEGTMGSPVNRDKTKIVPVKNLSMLGLHRKNGKWCMDRGKEEKACDKFLSMLHAGGKENRKKAIQQFKGFLHYYRSIPDLAESKVPSLQRWMERKILEIRRKVSGGPSRTIEPHPVKVS